MFTASTFISRTGKPAGNGASIARFLILINALLIVGCQSIPPTARQKTVDVRIPLTSHQRDMVGSRERLPLTQKQANVIEARTGKRVKDVKPVYRPPDGEVGELGYNLALRDRAESILLLGRFVMNPDEVAVKRQDNARMIAIHQSPDLREHASFRIGDDGRLWRFIRHDEWLEHFCPTSLTQIQMEKPASIASRDTLRYVRVKSDRKADLKSRRQARIAIDDEGRLWRFMKRKEFSAYMDAHRSNFGVLYFQKLSTSKADTPAFRNTRQFVKMKLGQISVWAHID